MRFLTEKCTKMGFRPGPLEELTALSQSSYNWINLRGSTSVGSGSKTDV